VITLEQGTGSATSMSMLERYCIRRLGKVGNTKSFERGDIRVYIVYTPFAGRSL
jgi:hypothetical protein